MKTKIIFILCAIYSLNVFADDSLPLVVTESGVEIESVEMGKFVIEPPVVNLSNGRSEKGAIDVLSATEGVAKYSGGGEINIRISGNEIAYQFSSGPNYKGFMFQMPLPLKLNQGCKFALDGAAFREFPASFGGQFVDKGDSKKIFSLVDAMGAGFSLAVPANWAAIQDNRAFNLSTYAFQFVYDMAAHTGEKSLTITVDRIKKAD